MNAEDGNSNNKEVSGEATQPQNLNPEPAPEKEVETSEVKSEEKNVENLKIGSNGATQEANSGEVAKAPSEPPKAENIVEQSADPAPEPASAETPEEKLEEKDGKNVTNTQVTVKEGEAKKEYLKTLSVTAQPSITQEPKPQIAKSEIESSEINKDGVDKEQENSITQQKEEEAKEEPKEAVQTAPEPVKSQSPENSPSKKKAEIDENGSPTKIQGNTENRPSPPRRNLRERRVRSTRNGDGVSKCHICEKNSLRVNTLIPCTQGSDSCEVYF